MSFCPSCGKELSAEESTAKYCAYCGKPLAAEEPVVEEAPVTGEALVFVEATSEQPAPEIKANLIKFKDKVVALCNTIMEKVKTVPALAGIVEKIDKKFYPAVVAAPVVVVLFVLVLVIGAFSAGSYMTPINEYLNAANKKVTSTTKVIYSLTPNFRDGLLKDAFSKLSKADNYSDIMENYDDNFKDVFDELDDEFKSWKIGFTEKSSKKLDKDDLEDLEDTLDDAFDDRYEGYLDNFEEVLDDEDDLEEFADSFDMKENEAKNLLKAMIKYYESFEDMKVTEAYEVKGKFTIKADKDEWESDSVKITVLKVNNNWVIGGIDGEITFDDDDEEIELFESLFSRIDYNYASYDIFYSILFAVALS